MQIKRYEASGVQEALTRIREDLGRDAVILSTKRLRRGKIPLIEVTAAWDMPNEKGPAAGLTAEARKGACDPEPEKTHPTEDFRTEIQEIKSLLESFKRDTSLRRDIGELRESVNTLFDLLGLLKNEQGYFSVIYHHLLACGISRERAYKLMEGLKAEFAVVEKNNYRDALKGLEDLIRKSIGAAEKKLPQKRAIALVGPTGVGKTTTLAKLAAYCALEEKKKVGLITTDTYRIAATEQLKVYARIMGIPMEVAAEKEALREAIRKFSDRDLILVDTPGRRPSDSAFIRQTADILDQEIPLRMCLLLSLTSSRENMLDAAAKFSAIPYESLIFTKIDECTNCGPIYDVVDQVGKPVAYITNGQNVPKDIFRATPGRIARLIVGNQLN